MTEMEEIQQKLQAFCAGRERCSSEVMNKLKLLGADDETAQQVIVNLKMQKFLDDRRYCFNFVRKAFEEKQKGRKRISEELISRELDEALIEEALNGITDEEFSTLLMLIIKKEISKLKPDEIPGNTARILRKLCRDGFDEEEVATIFSKHFNIDILN